MRAPGKRASTSRSALARPGRSTRNSSRHVVFSDEDESSSQRPQRSLRERKNRPNYQLIPAEESGSRTSPRKKKSSASSYGTVVGGGKSSGGGYNRIPWGVSGKELGKYMGLQDSNDSSDDEFAAAKSAAASAGAGSAGMLGGAGGGLFNSGMPMDMAGGPSNLGKVGDAGTYTHTLSFPIFPLTDAISPCSFVRRRSARRQHQGHLRGCGRTRPA